MNSLIYAGTNVVSNKSGNNLRDFYRNAKSGIRKEAERTNKENKTTRKLLMKGKHEEIQRK